MGTCSPHRGPAPLRQEVLLPGQRGWKAARTLALLHLLQAAPPQPARPRPMSCSQMPGGPSPHLADTGPALRSTWKPGLPQGAPPTPLAPPAGTGSRVLASESHVPGPSPRTGSPHHQALGSPRGTPHSLRHRCFPSGPRDARRHSGTRDQTNHRGLACGGTRGGRWGLREGDRPPGPLQTQQLLSFNHKRGLGLLVAKTKGR